MAHADPTFWLRARRESDSHRSTQIW